MTGFAKFVTATAIATLAPFAASASAYQNDAGPLVTATSYEQVSDAALIANNPAELQATYRNEAGPLVTSDSKADLHGNAPVVSRNNQPVTGSNSSGAIFLAR
ncbi:hypothetical protein [Pseudooceanicola sp. HF7]|uniref:hypothetical protein n=1 Tax=Pseudooceanicola sp. HF7 TaxID=2721560 RepID=UPI0014318C3C|nr:hypothetical protein [Pseudooceanicola sp. HF7]NIZ11568.1 hypothetical protein [Pseudooceanicola sp. HF7]